LKATGTKRLKLKPDELLSGFAFNFNLRGYNTDDDQGPDSGGDDPERRLCIICYDRPRAHRFDCGHMTVCEECAVQLPLQAVPQQYRTAANRYRRMRLCPTCRAPMDGVGAPADPHDSTYVRPTQPPPTVAASPGTGSFHAVVARMRPHSGDAAAQAQACEELIEMTAINDENQTRAGAAGAVEAAVAAMRAHPQSGLVQVWALPALLCMTRGNAENLTRAVDAGAVVVVVAAMHIHPRNRQVQMSACSALGDMTRDNAEIQTRAGNGGAVEALVAAMLAHPQSNGVQWRACSALNAVTRDNAENQARAGNGGAVEAAVAAMRGLPPGRP